MNIDPRGMTFIDWSDRMNLVLDPVRSTERYHEGEPWQDWAEGLMDSPTREGQNIPDPWGFEEWSEWAMRFNQVVDMPG